MRGIVDRLGRSMISGWVHDLASPESSVQVQIFSDNKLICEGLADKPRPDVNKELKIAGDCGFVFGKGQLASLEAEAIGKIQVRARSSAADAWVDLPSGPNAIDSRPQETSPPYQSFGDVPGASNSAAKLSALRLSRLPNSADPEHPLKGLSVLDLGCNEGYFCIEAVRQGASRVVGIDRSQRSIKLAKERCPNAEFVQGTWWEIPNEQFDVILFLSALHYEPNQKLLLSRLAHYLKPGGVLVIECGVAPGAGDHRSWTAIERWDGIRRYPSHDLFKHDILDSYAVRWMGASVAQKGDPIPRHVFHCMVRKSIALLIAGHSYTGKSVLADVFASRGIPLFRIDYFLSRLVKLDSYNWSEVAQALRQFRGASEIRIDLAGRHIVEHGMSEKFAEILMMEVPLDARQFCIEGEILRHAPVLNSVVVALEKRGSVPWVILPGSGQPFDISLGREFDEVGASSLASSEQRTIKWLLNSWVKGLKAGLA